MHIDSDLRIKRIAETVDRLVTLDIWCKFAGRDAVQEMYEAALSYVKPKFRSLCYAAADALHKEVAPAKRVLICTGLVLPPWMVAESDGPPGAAVLARVLNLALKCSPVILVPPKWIVPMRQVAIAAGLTPVDDADLLQGRRGACAVLGFPVDDDAASELAKRWLSAGDVAAVIAIEAPGRTESGRFLTGAHAWDIAHESSRYDYLFEEANSRNILTIGIGDHGGELGLAPIADVIGKVVPTARAGDPTSIIPAVPARIPLVAGISNWGAYGVAAVLAAIAGRIDLLHKGEDEVRILRAAAQAGFLAGMVGMPVPMVDGISDTNSSAFVDILYLAVSRGLESPFPRAVGFTPNA